MAFHRFKDPAYFGSASFPGPIFGETYDRINVVSEGVGTGDGSAVVVGQKAVPHPNAGTYFVAFGEDGISSHVNRGLRALTDNTDYIDDVLHRDLGVPSILTPPVPAGPIGTMVLTGDVFVGPAGTPNNVASLSSLVVLLDASNNPLHFLSAGVWVAPKVTQIHDGANNNVIGQGFYTNPTIDITPLIPGGVAFRVGHAVRGRVVNQPAGLISRLGSGWSGTEDLWALARNITQTDQTFLGNNTHSGVNSFIGTNTFSNVGTTSIAEAAAAGAPVSMGSGTVTSHIQTLLDELNLHLNGTYPHPDDELTSATIVGAPNSLSGGSVRDHLTELLGFINGFGGASGISYAGGPSWKNGETNPATTVELQLDKIISDLANPSTFGVAGGYMVGVEIVNLWADGSSIVSDSVALAIGEIVQTLKVADGPDKLGGVAAYAATPDNGIDLAAGSLAAQLKELADQVAGRGTLAGFNTWAGQQTWSGATDAHSVASNRGIVFSEPSVVTVAGQICRANTVKAWAHIPSHSGVVGAEAFEGYNIASITSDDTGQPAIQDRMLVSIDDNMADADYVAIVQGEELVVYRALSRGVASFEIVFWNMAGTVAKTLGDISGFSIDILVIGNQ